MKDQLWDLKTLGANDVSEMTYKYCVKCDIKHYSLPLIGLLLLLKGSVMMTRFQLFLLYPKVNYFANRSALLKLLA